MQAIEDIAIDSGTFKYVLISLQDRKDTASTKLIVRGHVDCGYHQDVLERARREVYRTGLDVQVQVLGGGRMEHHSDQRALSIYGYSSAFGQAPHDVTAAITRKWLPLHDIHVSYDGY